MLDECVCVREGCGCEGGCGGWRVTQTTERWRTVFISNSEERERHSIRDEWPLRWPEAPASWGCQSRRRRTLASAWTEMDRSYDAEMRI